MSQEDFRNVYDALVVALFQVMVRPFHLLMDESLMTSGIEAIRIFP